MKPTSEAIQFAKSVYEEVIITQIVEHGRIREAFIRLNPEDKNPRTIEYMKRNIFNYFNYQYPIELKQSLQSKLEDEIEAEFKALEKLIPEEKIDKRTKEFKLNNK